MTAEPGVADLDASFLVVLSALTYGCLRQGGFRRDGFAVVAVLTVGAAIVSLIRYLPHRGDLRRLVLPIGLSLLALGASTVLSGVFAGSPWGAVAARLALVGIVFGGFVAAASVGESARWVAGDAVAAVGAFVGLSGWFGAVLRRAPLGYVADGLWRASSWLTYPNALGALCIVCFFPAVSAAAARPRWWRWLLCWTLLVAAGSSQSRGAALGVVIGCGALLFRQPGRAVARAVLVVGVGAAPAVAAALVRSPVEDSAPLIVVVVGTTVGLGVLAAAVRWRRAVVGVGAMALVAVVLTAAGRLDAVVSSRLSARSPVAGGEQHEPLLGDRSRIWKAAFQQWQAHPVFGTGPSKTELAWRSDDGQRYVAAFVHNEYLELAASQGAVGLLAFGAAGVVAARSTRPARRRRDPQRVGTHASIVAFGLMSALDFLWRLPVLPLVVAVLFGLATGANGAAGADGADRNETPERLRRRRWALGGRAEPRSTACT